MSEQNSKEHRPDQVRKNRYGWLVYLLAFLILQFVFYLLDDYTGWHIFNLNPFGEKVVSFINPLIGWFQVYDTPQFNVITVVWGFVIMIYGVYTVSKSIKQSIKSP